MKQHSYMQQSRYGPRCMAVMAILLQAFLDALKREGETPHEE